MSEEATKDKKEEEGKDETKMPLLAHLVELRSRLLWCIGSFIVLFFSPCKTYL